MYTLKFFDIAEEFEQKIYVSGWMDTLNDCQEMTLCHLKVGIKKPVYWGKKTPDCKKNAGVEDGKENHQWVINLTSLKKQKRTTNNVVTPI